MTGDDNTPTAPGELTSSNEIRTLFTYSSLFIIRKYTDVFQVEGEFPEVSFPGKILHGGVS